MPFWKGLAGVALLLAIPHYAALAEESQDNAALRTRVEELERKLKRLEELLERQSGAPAAPVAEVPASAPAVAAPAAPDPAVQQQIEALDQQVRILGRKQEIEAEAAAARAKEAPTVTVGKDGFGLRSADGAYRLHFGGVIQADARGYLTNEFPGAAPDTFVMRRVRSVIEGTFREKFGFLVRTEFGNAGAISLLDGYVDLNFTPSLRVRGGKFKGPVGLERLQSPRDMAFVERAFPTQLLPNRDLGFQVFGDVLAGRLSYAAGFFDGVRDGASLDTDNNSSKDVQARLFAHPFRGDGNPWLEGLGIGIAGTSGTQGGTVAAGNLSSYLTPGQQTFFAYSTGTYAAGSRQRLSPQLYYYNGPLGVMAEYATVQQEVSRGTNHRELRHNAWQVYATWVLTGEDAGYTRVTPRRDFDWDRGAWGAWETGIRLSGLRVDDDAFLGPAATRLADPSASARKATDVGLVLNWYLNRNIKLQANYDQTRFSGGAANGRDLPDEKVLFTRMQAAF